jgi:hypothetical protein
MALPFESAKVTVNWPLQFNSHSPNVQELLLAQEEAIEKGNLKRSKSRQKSRSPSGQSNKSNQSGESTTLTPETGALCTRCAKIDIGRLISKKPGFQKRLGPVSRWKPKRCVFCRFLFELLPPATRSNPDPEESYELWTFQSSQTSQNLWCTVDVPLLKVVSSNLFSGPGIPWILPHCEHTSSSVRLLEPVIDFAAARRWLKLCLQHHGDACTSHVKSIVRNLKVIDCQSRMVVSAKDSDDYLVLSYTWGDEERKEKPAQHQQNAGFLRLPIQFPATILVSERGNTR